MSSRNEKAAVIFASVEDKATESAFGAAQRVADLLQSVGYRVFSFFPPRATSAQLYVELAQHTVYETSGKEPLDFIFGFFCAHGHDTELGLADRHGNLLVELSHCRHFRNAILVCCSCLENKRFPICLTQLSGSVSAVIGYTPALSICERNAVAGWSGDKFSRYLEVLVEPLIQPAWSLLHPGCTVEQALDQTKDMWLLGSMHPSVTEDLRLVFEWRRNVLRASAWGECSAALTNARSLSANVRGDRKVRARLALHGPDRGKANQCAAILKGWGFEVSPLPPPHIPWVYGIGYVGEASRLGSVFNSGIHDTGHGLLFASVPQMPSALQNLGASVYFPRRPDLLG